MKAPLIRYWQFSIEEGASERKWCTSAVAYVTCHFGFRALRTGPTKRCTKEDRQKALRARETRDRRKKASESDIKAPRFIGTSLVFLKQNRAALRCIVVVVELERPRSPPEATILAGLPPEATIIAGLLSSEIAAGPERRVVRKQRVVIRQGFCELCLSCSKPVHLSVSCCACRHYEYPCIYNTRGKNFKYPHSLPGF